MALSGTVPASSASFQDRPSTIMNTGTCPRKASVTSSRHLKLRAWRPPMCELCQRCNQREECAGIQIRWRLMERVQALEVLVGKYPFISQNQIIDCDLSWPHLKILDLSFLQLLEDQVAHVVPPEATRWQHHDKKYFLSQGLIVYVVFSLFVQTMPYTGR